MTRTHKAINLTGIIMPFVGLVLAVALLWHRFVGPKELAILLVGYLLTGVGVTVGYHRLFTHRSFETFKPIWYAFAVLGEMAVESDVVTWVADHRKHHQFSDKEGDPHSPHVGYGDGPRGFAARPLARAHGLALPDGRARRPRPLRQGSRRGQGPAS